MKKIWMIMLLLIAMVVVETTLYAEDSQVTSTNSSDLKDNGIALGQSLLFSGLGHNYAGDYSKGVGYTLGEIICWGLIIGNPPLKVSASTSNESVPVPGVLVGAIGIVVVKIMAGLDSMKLTEEYNKKIKENEMNVKMSFGIDEKSNFKIAVAYTY